MSTPRSTPKRLQMIEAVVSPFEGAPASIRRHWSDDFKAEIAAESLLPGASASAIAQRLGIDSSQIYQWRKQAIQKGWITKLKPLPAPRSKAPVQREVSASVIELVINDITIRSVAENDDAHLARVIRAARQS
jgi:transposase